MNFLRAVVLIALGCLAAAQDAPPSGTVEGTVINSGTGVGIGGVPVTLFATATLSTPGSNSTTKYQTTSDAAGYFKITGVAPGSYRPSAEKDGYAPASFDLSAMLASGVRVTSGVEPVKVEVKLTPLTTVRGRVSGPDGKPVAGVEVSLAPNLTADNAVTDAEGRFALENIRAGSYLLIAKPPTSAKPAETAGGTRTALLSTYYPSASDPSLSQQIVLRGLEDPRGYEIKMQTAEVHRIRGIVLDEEGKPASRVALTLLTATGATPAALALGRLTGQPSFFALGIKRVPGLADATAITGGDGHFEFPAVRSGDWRIEAVSDPIGYAPGGRSSRGTADALVGRGDVNDLQIHMAKPFKLTATVEWKADDPNSKSQPLSGMVTLFNPEGNEFVSSGRIESGKVSFENLVPGRYALIFKPGISAQTFLGESEVTGPISVTAADPRLRIVLKTRAGSLRGTVEKGEGSTVVLIPQASQGVVIGQTVVCGAGGSFEMGEVSPGDYYIGAFDHVEGMAPPAAVLSLVRSRGVSVKVEEHSAANVILPVILAR